MIIVTLDNAARIFADAFNATEVTDPRWGHSDRIISERLTIEKAQDWLDTFCFNEEGECFIESYRGRRLMLKLKVGETL